MLTVDVASSAICYVKRQHLELRVEGERTSLEMSSRMFGFSGMSI